MPGSAAVARDIPPRLELKYWLSERHAEALRRDVEALLTPDPHTPGPGRGYALSSLYFDTPDLRHYRSTVRGDHDRIKLRARVYDEAGPVHLEVKRKTHDTIRKSRGRVARAAWVDVAEARTPDAHVSAGADAGADVALPGDVGDVGGVEAFVHAFVSGACRPTCLVRYEREAYVSPLDRYGRVTFDRHITATSAHRMSFTGDGEPVALDRATQLGALEGHVLIELKAERLIPSWMSELVRMHGLRRVAFSKYGAGMDAIMHAQLRQPSWRSRYF